MEQKEIISWAMLAIQHELLLQEFLEEDVRQELERKYKELADLYTAAIFDNNI